jgi:hypothetical protein
MWNMAKDGFRRLYEAIPGAKPPFEEAWRWTGGNPHMLLELHKSGWNVDRVVKALIRDKELTSSFIAKWRRWLEKAVEDPEALWSPDAPEELIKQLVERNLIVYNMYDRDPYFWIDQPHPRETQNSALGKTSPGRRPYIGRR